MTLARILLLALCLTLQPATGADEKTLPAYTQKIQTPKLALRNTTLRDALDKLPVLAMQASPNEKLPALVLIGPPALAQRRITVEREAGKLEDAVRAIAAQAGCEIDWEPHGIVIREKGTKPLPAIPVEKVKAVERYYAKVAKQVLPRVELQDLSLRESVEFLVQKSGVLSPDLEGGVGLRITPDLERGEQPKIHLTATDLPLLEAFRYIAGQAVLNISMGMYGLTIESHKEAALRAKEK